MIFNPIIISSHKLTAPKWEGKIWTLIAMKCYEHNVISSVCFFWLAIILRSFKLTAFFSLCDIWYFALFNFFGVIFTFEVAAIFSTQFTYSSNRGRLINASARVVVHTMPENNVPFCIKCHSQWIALFHCIVCLLPIWTFHIFLNQFYAL